MKNPVTHKVRDKRELLDLCMSAVMSLTPNDQMPAKFEPLLIVNDWCFEALIRFTFGDGTTRDVVVGGGPTAEGAILALCRLLHVDPFEPEEDEEP